MPQKAMIVFRMDATILTAPNVDLEERCKIHLQKQKARKYNTPLHLLNSNSI